MLKDIRYLIVLSTLGILVTALVYARPFPSRILLYILITCLYTGFIVFIHKKYRISFAKASFFVLATPFLIDASVILTNPYLVPLRFPFASVFLLLAAALAYLIISQKRAAMVVGAVFSLAFFFVSDRVFIPHIISRMEQRTDIKVPQDFLSKRFLNASGDTLLLSSVLAPTSFIDFYFVGCAPCYKKERMFRQLVNEHPDKDFAVVFICNGAISSYSDFQRSKMGVPTEKLLYLYDFDGQISKYLPGLNSYPFEAVVQKGSIVKYYWGMNKESYALNIAARIKYIEGR